MKPGLGILLLFPFFCLSGQSSTPDWARDAIWYQIFPERFRNGDVKNDPTKEELEFPAAREWHSSPWTSDWYQLQPWEARFNPDFYHNVLDRRYGGDLQGVIDKLDYLSSLGINAIYFNPVFEAYSLHKYDASYYHHIDKNFGPDAAGDRKLMELEDDNPATWHWTAADSLFLKLIRAAHARHIRIIIDGVFNHSGTRSFAFRDVVKNQRRSRYAEWYDIRQWDDPATPANEFRYKGWWDEPTLPEFREDANGFSPAVKQYFFNVTKRWMDPNGDGDPGDGIDGWRLDVANDVSHVFWKEWRKVVKRINPDAYLVAELWDDAQEWLRGDEFDATMNYPFARASVQYFINTGSMKTTATQFAAALAAARARYPDEANFVLQNLLDSHDTDRLLSMIANPNRRYNSDNGLRGNARYFPGKPGEEARRTMKLMTLFQMTYLGAPMIYYGDEAGMWGANDPDERKPMVWSDLTYERETTHPLPGGPPPNDNVEFDKNLFSWYQQLIAVRNANVALRRGSFAVLKADDANDVLVFQRVVAGNRVIVAINNSKDKRIVELNAEGNFTDALDGTHFIATRGAVKLPLLPVSGRILVTGNK